MGRRLVALIAGAGCTALLLIASFEIAELLVPPAVERVEPRVVEEDDPGWDCRTMGNRDCGGGHVDTGNVLDSLSPGFYWDGDEWMWRSGA